MSELQPQDRMPIYRYDISTGQAQSLRIQRPESSGERYTILEAAVDYYGGYGGVAE